MKILMISSKDGYGLYSHTSNLIRELSKMPGIDLHVVNIVDDAAQESKTQRSGRYTSHYVTYSNSRFGFVRGLVNISNIRKKILDVSPDIVHVQSVGYTILASLLLKRKYPIVCTVHSLVARDYKMAEWAGFLEHINRKIMAFLENTIILRSLTDVIVVSPKMRELIEDKSNAKMYIIPNGIDPQEVRDIAPRSVKHPSVLYVGRLTKRKGIDVLLKAMPEIIRSIPQTSLLVLGTGPQEDELRRLVDDVGMGKNVNLLGFISGGEKYAYYKSADVCVVPSIDYDYAPIVLSEAMFCGKPIVASGVGGIPQIVDDKKTGLLVKPNDVDELADRIIVLLRDKKLRDRMGEAGRKKMMNFTWDRIASKTIGVYGKVIEDYESRKN